MKKFVEEFVRTGMTGNPIFTLQDLFSWCYIFRFIADSPVDGVVIANDNAFWKEDNIKKRIELANDIKAVRRKNIRDTSFFHILNRFENGDKYGIVTTKA